MNRLIFAYVLFVFAGGFAVAEPVESDHATEQAEGAQPAGALVGKVENARGEPVVGAHVAICDAAGGIPLHKQSLCPFTQLKQSGPKPLDLAYAVTDDAGRFAFDALPPGQYRLVAQVWKDAEKVAGLLEVNGKVIELCGTAENVRVVAGGSTEATLRPLGTGVLKIDEDLGNDETLLVVSTSPLRADPILRFAGWIGPFLKNLIGANRMPHGETTIHGLPEGTLHLAVFAADNSPGWGACSVTIRPGATTVAYAPIVAAWSDGRHTPPDRLVPLVEELKKLPEAEPSRASGLLKSNGIELDTSGNPWHFDAELAKHLDRAVTLPSGTTTTVGDLFAASGYIKLDEALRKRRERRKQPAGRAPPPVNPNASYEEAFVALYRELGANYPCFELKKIDWAAVGETLLPRAKEVSDDASFGLLCLELVARLEDSHAYLARAAADLPQAPYPRWSPGFACLIDDRDRPVVYTVAPNGPAKTVGVRVGMTVVSIQGRPVAEAIETCMKQTKQYSGYSSGRYLRYHSARWFPRQSERGTPVVLQMESPEGKQHTFEIPATLGVGYLPRLPVPIRGIADSGSVSWTRLDGNLGYIYVRRIGRDLIDKLDRAVAELADAKGLILDVRGNSGGRFDAARSHRNFAPNDPEEPDRPRFGKPIAILIDSRCISAGEGWASWFFANDRAIAFGETTAGASSRKTTYTLTNGMYRVTYPVKAYSGYLNRPIERRGLEPDRIVRPNAQDLAAGRDTVLEAARRELLR